MSEVVSLEFQEEQRERRRRSEFAFLDFRDSPAGRQAYIQGTSLAVWEVVMVAQNCGMDVAKTADHLRWPLPRVQAALSYAAAYPAEIEAALRENDAMDFASLSRMLPQATQFLIQDEAPDEGRTQVAPHPA